MSTTKRESLHQVQKSYQHAILLHPQGSHPKEIKILTHSLHGQITCSVFERYTPCPAKETGKNTKSLIQRETKTEDQNSYTAKNCVCAPTSRLFNSSFPKNRSMLRLLISFWLE